MVSLALSNELQFLREFLARPFKVAAPVPSSRKLAEKIAEQVDPRPGGVVLELGPGTGAVTRAICERGVAGSDLIAIESDSRFVALLRQQLPRVHVIEGDAFGFRALLRDQASGLRSIVSGLPVLGRPIELRRRLIADAIMALKPGRPFIQFSYGAAPPLPSVEGLDVQRAATVWQNFPPMHVLGLSPLADEIPEGHRVAKPGAGGNAMFPFPARRTGKHVGGTRQQFLLVSLPLRVMPAAESHQTRRKKRERNDLSEHGLVAMPADFRPLCIFGNERLLERCRFEVGNGCRSPAQILQEIRKCRAAPQGSNQTKRSGAFRDSRETQTA